MKTKSIILTPIPISKEFIANVGNGDGENKQKLHRNKEKQLEKKMKFRIIGKIYRSDSLDRKNVQFIGLF